MELFTRREILSVGQLVGRLKRITEEAFDFVWVEGEISGLRTPASGHMYFALKDDQASLRAVLFKHQASLLRFALEEGLQVLCQGRVSVYQPRGEVQLVVDSVEPRGAGALALAFEQLRKRLKAEGLFDQARKQALPELPARVAVVTSPSGAAIRDFLNVLHRRDSKVAVGVYPVRVQGFNAAPQMIEALQVLAAWGWPQVIVLTRGGGSPEDLQAFNDEYLARAIADCPIPVVSAVGHEIDVSISDLVADLRAPTPSAAAELLVKNRAELEAGLKSLSVRLGRAGERMLSRRRAELSHLARALGDPRRRLADKRLRVDDLLSRAGHALQSGLHQRGRAVGRLYQRSLAARPDRRLAETRSWQRELALRLASAGVGAINTHRQGIGRLEARLRALSPLAVLGRGFALATDSQGRVLRRAQDTAKGRKITVRLAQGSLKAKVEEVQE
ncbi:MAG: exodeoxyribonuclease VII large subunit [Desulfarculaceae bacterium]|nr:exodeoxyribonuclease VII large subunit [Desulfarculaceae bacterium]MCF8071775.1 exodeoxyribonuclease VII large subunit [Desulfarculaceae bacterium]MCF8101325.1 exodeoxyribonuclease VII large subunit [Desulfarculaceae bacterium]MCF8117284.1 exodeoxyribonuclease VII large subunit [Desulfarculaceae bacterium]